MTERYGGRPSLKWKLIGILLACWLLPVFIIVAVLGGYAGHNLARQRTEFITSAARNAAELVNSRMESAVVSSRNASYYGAVENAYHACRDGEDIVALYNAVNAFLMRQYKYDDKFLSATVFFHENPDQLSYVRNNRFGSQAGRYSEVHEAVQKLSENLGTKMGFISQGNRLYMVRNLIDGQRLFEPFGVLVLELNPNSMFESLSNIPWCTDASIQLNDAEIILRGESSGLADLPEGEGLLERGDRFYIRGGEKRSDYRFSYSIALDGGPLLEESTRLRYLLVLVITLAVPLLAAAIRFTYVNITRPVDKLVAATRHIKGGSLGYQAEPEASNREFRDLTDAFNSMSTRLKEQFERIYSEELALRDARIMALQSQLNPHFLNNTLEIINWEARLAENRKVSRMIEALSTLLDAAMDREGKPEVRLAEEMIYVDAYLYIITERLGKRLTVEKEIPQELLERMVPRLILQPIIENAVEHGANARQRHIVIRAFREPEAMVLEIWNDGSLSQEDREQIALLLSDRFDTRGERSGNLGIHNVHQRLGILYGAGSGLSISDDGQGHVVSRIVIRDRAAVISSRPL